MQSMQISNISYRKDIDGLRSIAILPVVLGHAGVAGFQGGFIGVDVFFVISGFLITSILIREISEGTYSLTDFYERRARRIIPALFAVLLASIITGWLVLLPDSFIGLGQSVLATLSFLSNVWFWQKTGDYFSSEAEFEPLLHTWSLAVEEQFYIVFPIFLCFIARAAPKSIAFWVLLPCLASFALSIWATSAAPTANFYLSPTRVWELGAGALLAIGALPPLRNEAMRETIAFLGIGLILGSIYWLSPDTPFPGLAALPGVTGTTLLIWIGTGGPTTVGRLLSCALPVWFGLISYSLYLWHWPILAYFRVMHGSIDLPPATAALAIFLSILMAWMSCQFVERPFRKRGLSGYSRPSIFAFSVAGAAAIAVISSAILARNGFEGRIKPELLAEYNENVERSPKFKSCMGKTVEAGFCERGKKSQDAGEARVLIWGDSHAAAMLPGFDRWLTGRALSGLAAVKSACPPFWGVKRIDQEPNHGCDIFNADVLAFLETQPNIETVFLAARWALAVEGERADGEAGRAAILGLAQAVELPRRISDNADLSMFALEQTVRRLREQGKNVVIIEGVPEVGFSVPRALLNADFIGISPPEAPNRSDFEFRNARANKMISDMVEMFGVVSVSVADLLCDDECRIYEGGRSLYQDDDHLSVFASEKLIPIIAEKGFEALTDAPKIK